jgi:hypothetical protein
MVFYNRQYQSHQSSVDFCKPVSTTDSTVALVLPDGDGFLVSFFATILYHISTSHALCYSYQRHHFIPDRHSRLLLLAGHPWHCEA